MTEMPKVAPGTVVRITDAWVTPAKSGGLAINLDPAGLGGPGDIPMPDEAEAFSLVAALMSLNRAVYYSHATGSISTDPFFGTNPHLAEFGTGGAQEVLEADPMWDFNTKSGHLLLTLENRAQYKYVVNDIATLVGWTLTIGAQRVLYDGEMLTAPRPE